MNWINNYIKYVGFVFSSIWRLWFFIVFLIVFIILIPPLYFFTRIIPNQKTVCNITRLWSRLTLLFSGVFLNVKYEKEIDENENYIICPNHISTIDIPVILAALKLPIIFTIFNYVYEIVAYFLYLKNKKQLKN